MPGFRPQNASDSAGCREASRDLASAVRHGPASAACSAGSAAGGSSARNPPLAQTSASVAAQQAMVVGRLKFIGKPLSRQMSVGRREQPGGQYTASSV